MENVMSEEPADKKRKTTPRPITAKARTLPLKTRRLLRMTEKTGRTARTAMPPKRAARRSSS
jgi:hypothetical protein